MAKQWVTTIHLDNGRQWSVALPREEVRAKISQAIHAPNEEWVTLPYSKGTIEIHPASIVALHEFESDS